MAPWPRERLERALPFQFTGLDALGPVMIRSMSDQTKIWVCLFTCFVTRAVHLEVMSGLSAEAFLGSFRRFVFRRGYPERILSDNAPQFHLAETALTSSWRDLVRDREVQAFAATNSIAWKFTSQYSPWEGGLYERIVGLVKRSLRKAIGSCLLTLDQFSTLLTEVEAVLNTRPLAYVNSESATIEPLTPAHFLAMHRQIGVCLPLAFETSAQSDESDPEYMPEKRSADTLRQKSRHEDAVANEFWARWKKEYLLTLRERTMHHKQPRTTVACHPQPGDIVVVQDESLPRSVWKLAKVVQVHTSVDDEARTATIMLPNKRLTKRSLCQLYFLLKCHLLATLILIILLTNKWSNSVVVLVIRPQLQRDPNRAGLQHKQPAKEFPNGLLNCWTQTESVNA